MNKITWKKICYNLFQDFIIIEYLLKYFLGFFWAVANKVSKFC